MQNNGKHRHISDEAMSSLTQEALKNVDTAGLLESFSKAYAATQSISVDALQSSEAPEGTTPVQPAKEPETESVEETSDVMVVRLERFEEHIAELQRQADAQERMDQALRDEAAARAKDDKKYFWLGALVSFVTAMLVEHGPTLLSVLRPLIR